MPSRLSLVFDNLNRCIRNHLAWFISVKFARHSVVTKRNQKAMFKKQVKHLPSHECVQMPTVRWIGDILVELTDAYMRQNNIDSLVQLIVDRMFSAKPLYKAVLTYCQYDHHHHHPPKKRTPPPPPPPHTHTPKKKKKYIYIYNVFVNNICLKMSAK